MLIISDIHGCKKTLEALLKKCPDDELVFAGDLVDRGPDSSGVIQFAIDNKVPTVMGNHEHMLLDHFVNGLIYEDGLWVYNGGGFKVEVHHLEWIRNLPFRLTYGDLTVQHTAYEEGIRTFYYMPEVWYRGFPKRNREGFIVFGHTPSKEPIIENDFAMIDTGCAYYDRGYGILTALQYPQMRIFQQEYCD